MKLIKELEPDFVFEGSYASLEYFMRFSVLCLGGVFVKDHFCWNINQRKYFQKFRERNPNFFDTATEARGLGFHRVSLAGAFELGLEDHYDRKLDDITIARNLLFGFFCRDQNVIRSASSPSLRIDGKPFWIDNFENDNPPTKNATVFTIPDRFYVLQNRVSNFMIPEDFKEKKRKNKHSKMFLSLLENFQKNRKKFPLKEFYNLYSNRDLLANWIWPICDSEIHLDKREYIGFPNPINGFEKLEKDIQLIFNSSSRVRLYKFGLYPK